LDTSIEKEFLDPDGESESKISVEVENGDLHIYHILTGDSETYDILKREMFLPCFINGWPDKFAYAFNQDIETVQHIFSCLRKTFNNAVNHRAAEIVQLKFEDFHIYRTENNIHALVSKLYTSFQEKLTRCSQETIDSAYGDEETRTVSKTEFDDLLNDMIKNCNNAVTEDFIKLIEILRLKEEKYDIPLYKYASAIKLGADRSSFYKGVEAFVKDVPLFDDSELMKNWAISTFNKP
jgi:hypothetical protein